VDLFEAQPLTVGPPDVGVDQADDVPSPTSSS
jgi:hypothetical protein